jgi:hypothetical protein
LLAQATLLFGDLPGAALSTGRLAPAAAAALGAALLAWSAWWLPECDSLRRRLTRLRLIGQPCVAPLTALCSAALAACLLLITRPDGQLHVEPIAAGSGQAMFIRASTGRTALVVHGALDGTELTDQVAAHLHLWEHSLDTVVVLEPALSAGRLEPTLQRYPAEQVVHATGPTRLDFGGAALDLQVAADGLTIRSAPTTFEATRVQPD